jgi:hypothetical protein
MIGFIGLLQIVTTNNYNSLTELHAPKITVTTARLKSSQSSLAWATSFSQQELTTSEPQKFTNSLSHPPTNSLQ